MVHKSAAKKGLKLRQGWILALASLLPQSAALADDTGANTNPVSAQVEAMRRRGEKVFAQNCAGCHDHAEGRTPNREFLVQTKSPDYILRALTNGVMREVAQGLSLDEKRDVATYLIGTPPTGGAGLDINANRCAAPAPPMTLGRGDWNGWGGQGVTNARFQPAPGFTAKELPRLKLKWAFAYPGGNSNEPAVVGGRIFVSSMAGVTFSLDAKSGCTYWAKDLGVSTRAMISVGRMRSGKFAAYLTDWHGKVMALDAETGDETWSAVADDHRGVRLTGSPTLYDGKLYVPVSSGEEVLARDPNYRCCTFRGSLVAYDASTGRRLWKSYTIDKRPAPLPDKKNILGPSGNALWMAPTIDVRRKLIYVASGNEYSDMRTATSDAVIAIDLATGRKRWVSQVMARDVSVAGCVIKRHANCPDELGPDFDFGASPLLLRRAAGKDIVVAINKGGIAFGLAPDTGKILWRLQIGRGGLLGGLEWGASTDGKVIYAPIGDVNVDGNPPSGKGSFAARPGLNAIDPFSGKLLWHTPGPPANCSWKGMCVSAYVGAAASMPGAVFAGSWDGHIRAFASTNGALLWDFDTGASFKAVNGTTATGGALDHGVQTLGDGMLLVNSGSRMTRGGNALLAFTIDGK